MIFYKRTSTDKRYFKAAIWQKYMGLFGKGRIAMRFQYCPFCGKKAEKKEIDDEGLIPYCAKCEIPLWDMFTTSIIAVVVNENGEIVAQAKVVMENDTPEIIALELVRYVVE